MCYIITAMTGRFTKGIHRHSSNDSWNRLQVTLGPPTSVLRGLRRCFLIKHFNQTCMLIAGYTPGTHPQISFCAVLLMCTAPLIQTHTVSKEPICSPHYSFALTLTGLIKSFRKEGQSAEYSLVALNFSEIKERVCTDIPGSC